ncbi:MAG TPA: type II secretion system F family protein [Acidobacteriota bacterium]|nr:type II secretion system F family protein [Acidobacteriota bacterium]
MDIQWILGLGAGLLFVAVFLSGYALLMTRPKLEERLRGFDYVKQRFDFLNFLKRSEKVFKPLGELIPRPPEEMSRQERRLAQAGIRRRDAVYLFNGIKLASMILFFLVFTLIGPIRANVMLLILLPLLLGAMIPDLVLTRMIQKRKENLQRGLPDALDLAVVSVEAGLGLDQSLVKIGQELSYIYPALSEELNLYSLEVNAGKKRADALRNLGQRSDVDDLKSFTTVLIQTDRFGTSVAQSLRVFADTMRVKRRQRAEEHAAQMSVKMIPPLVFFIFPAILIVVLGPAVISLSGFFESISISGAPPAP